MGRYTLRSSQEHEHTSITEWDSNPQLCVLVASDKAQLRTCGHRGWFIVGISVFPHVSSARPLIGFNELFWGERGVSILKVIG